MDKETQEKSWRRQNGEGEEGLKEEDRDISSWKTGGQGGGEGALEDQVS